MPASLDIGVPYEVRHSTRAKRLQAVVRRGRVEVVVPRWARRAQVDAFIVEAAPWITKKAAEIATEVGTILPADCVTGASVLLEGDSVGLVVEGGAGRSARVLLDGRLIVRLPATAKDPEAAARRALLGWLRDRARAVAMGHIERYAPRLGRTPRGLRIKSQQTLWGSCGRTGWINLNWRLIGAPPGVFEYIVVHELCHLRERNHGPRFWHWVESLMPHYAPEKTWLRDHGRRLG